MNLRQGHFMDDFEELIWAYVPWIPHHINNWKLLLWRHLILIEWGKIGYCNEFFELNGFIAFYRLAALDRPASMILKTFFRTFCCTFFLGNYLPYEDIFKFLPAFCLIKIKKWLLLLDKIACHMKMKYLKDSKTSCLGNLVHCGVPIKNHKNILYHYKVTYNMWIHNFK